MHHCFRRHLLRPLKAERPSDLSFFGSVLSLALVLQVRRVLKGSGRGLPRTAAPTHTHTPTHAPQITQEARAVSVSQIPQLCQHESQSVGARASIQRPQTPHGARLTPPAPRLTPPAARLLSTYPPHGTLLNPTALEPHAPWGSLVCHNILPGGRDIGFRAAR